MAKQSDQDVPLAILISADKERVPQWVHLRAARVHDLAEVLMHLLRTEGVAILELHEHARSVKGICNERTAAVNSSIMTLSRRPWMYCKSLMSPDAPMQV